MPNVRVVVTSPLVQRVCLSCGYRGDEIQVSGERAAYRCPKCGQDLYARPPRSYAEMEGLQVQLVPIARVGSGDAGPDGSGRRRRAARLTLISRIIRAVLRFLRLAPRPTARPVSTTPQVHRPGVPRR